MTLSEIFKRLGAPLANTRWSWGAIRASDGAVFLRVWQGQVMKYEGKRYVFIAETPPDDEAPEKLRAKERLGQVANPREIMHFNKDDVFIGGELIKPSNSVYIELANPVPMSSVQANP